MAKKTIFSIIVIYIELSVIFVAVLDGRKFNTITEFNKCSCMNKDN